MEPSGRTALWAAGEVYEPYVGRWSRLVARAFLDWLAVPEGRDWVDVGCGTGALSLRELQRAGGKRLPADAFLRGHALVPGDSFEHAAPIESSPRSPI